jgi:hypothetical protein
VIINSLDSPPVGGTALAASLFAGAWARALVIDPSLGFAAPLIYADAKDNYASDFRDMAEGGNNGEVAAPGWDYPSGFGSVRVAAFVKHVAGDGSTDTQLLGNPGFETGTPMPWVTKGKVTVTGSGGGPVAHGGYYAAELQAVAGFSVAHLQQTVSIPSDKHSAVFSFWMTLGTTWCCSDGHALTVNVYDTGSGEKLETLASYTSHDESSEYKQQSFDLSAYIGRKVTLQFFSMQTPDNLSWWTIDDTALTVQ